jgi:flagellar motor switch/type III secretory pathway protein FliN
VTDAAHRLDNPDDDVSAQGPTRVRSLDLTGSQRHLRSALGALAAIAEGFGRNARRTLPFLLRQRVRFNLGEPAIGDPKDSDAAEHGPCYVVSLAGTDPVAWASLTLNGPCLARLLEGSLGNSQVSEGASLGDRLTLAQKVLIAKLATRLGHDFVDAIRKEIGLSFEVSGGQAADQEEDASADEKQRKDALYIELRLDGEDNGAGLVLAIGADVLDEAARDSDVHNAPKGDPRIAEALLEVKIPIIAELGRLSLGLGRVLALKKGQILRLPTLAESSIPVTINGVIKFEGTPVTSRGQLAVQIIDTKGRL